VNPRLASASLAGMRGRALWVSPSACPSLPDRRVC
jgi:hypothetical protein